MILDNKHIQLAWSDLYVDCEIDHNLLAAFDNVSLQTIIF